jgi:hypothetical protein
MAHSAVAVQKLLDGSYYDRIVAFVRYGSERAPLNPDDKVIFDRIERAKDLWVHHQDDRMVINMLMTEFGVRQAQAYNYLADSKAIHALFIKFDYMAEMLLELERINRFLASAEQKDSPHAKRADALFEQKRRLMQDIRDEQLRMKPDEPKQIHFHYHLDWTKLPGVNNELLDEWNKEFDEMEKRSRNRSGIEATDVEYTEERG